MKLLASIIKSEIEDFATFKIQYSVTENKYLFKYHFLEEIDDSEYSLICNDLKTKIIHVLKTSTKRILFLEEINKILESQIEFYYKKNIYKINSINPLDDIVEHTELLSNSSKERYSRDFILNYDEKRDGVQDRFFYHLSYFINKTDSKDPLDYEEVKLNYFTMLLYEEIEELNTFILKIIHNIKIYGLKDFDNWDEFEPIIAKTSKCNLNMTKLRVAQLFKILSKKELIHFNINPYKNKLDMQKFIESNFTYTLKKSKFCEIKNINKEYSELYNQHKNEQLLFVRELIEILEREEQELIDNKLLA